MLGALQYSAVSLLLTARGIRRQCMQLGQLAAHWARAASYRDASRHGFADCLMSHGRSCDTLRRNLELRAFHLLLRLVSENYWSSL